MKLRYYIFIIYRIDDQVVHARLAAMEKKLDEIMDLVRPKVETACWGPAKSDEELVALSEKPDVVRLFLSYLVDF